MYQKNNSILQNLTSIAKSYLQGLRKSIEYYIDRLTMTENLFMLIAALIIGVLAGFCATGIRSLIYLISEISFSGEGTFLERVISAPWYIKLIIPVIGGAIVGPVIYFLAPEAKGHGVPEVLHAILLKGGYIRPRVAFIKAFTSSVTIGTGGSVGREGPIIQIGASIGSTIAQFFNVPTRRMKTLVGCGAAAGIAAAFNAPVGGALFALEVILMDYSPSKFSPIVIASVMATVVSHSIEGDFAAFPVPPFVFANPWEIALYSILGILCGFVSWIFIKVLYFSEDVWDNKIKVPPYVKASIGGFVIGTLALFFPQVLGMGYDSISLALSGESLWYMAFILIFVKIFATSITLGSGGSGGVFAPALFMGAMLGAFFGYLANTFFPDITAGSGAYALVAMGGLLAGTMRAPITAIIIVFELTKDYNIFLPLMITCIISTILSTKLSRESIYTLKLLHNNIKLRNRAEVNIMNSILVRDVYKKDFTVITEDTGFDKIVKELIKKNNPYLFVNDLKGTLLGIISIHNIKEWLIEHETLQHICIAGDIADKSIEKVSLNDNCKQVLEKMFLCGYDGLPVIDMDKGNLQIGIIWRNDIDAALHKEIDRSDLAADLASKITLDNLEKDVAFLDGYAVTELPVPPFFVGKSLKELKIRSVYGVDVLTIKDNRGSIVAIPNAEHVFKHDEIIVIAGETNKINILKQI